MRRYGRRMRLKRVAVWIVVLLLAVEFTLAGASKLLPSSGWSRMFADWGFPSWFRLLIGATEVTCALALLVPRARLWACGVLLAIMAGAAATHLLHGEPRRVILNAALAALLGLLMLAQSRDFRIG
jgi:putative oxidoreductase